MNDQGLPSRSAFLERITDARLLLSVELRPPRSNLPSAESREAWIDANHSVRRLAGLETIVFLTDNAVSRREEENLQHLISNVGSDVDPGKLVPFLTCKHSLDYCTWYAQRAAQWGYRALVVLGGDVEEGTPRCVEHAWELRRLLKAKIPGLVLGGWANPNRDPVQQVRYLMDSRFEGEFFLTQVVSHFRIRTVEKFLAERERRGLSLPGVFGVFYYRSGSLRTLERLSRFMPVPTEEIRNEFASGRDPDEICAMTIQALIGLGLRKFYISNLPTLEAPRILSRLTQILG